jgi:predicted transposase/invertase (TIGR01784 family)
MGIEELLLDRAMKQGFEKGFKIGMRASEKKGARQKALEVARKLKKAGFSIVQIAEFTGLPIKEIEELQSS